MPNRIIFNDTANNLQTQIFGSDINSPVRTDVEGQLVVAPVGLSGDAKVQISGTPTVLFDPQAKVMISGIPTVDLAPNAKVEISGTPTVLFDPQAKVMISGIPTVDLAPNAKVEISGTPTVLFDPQAKVMISGIPTVDLAPNAKVQISGTPSVNIVGHGTLNVSTGLMTLTTTAPVPFLTYDVSQLSDFTYFLRNNSSASITAFVQVAPISNDNYFVAAPMDGKIVGPNQNELLVGQYYLQYARLQVQGADGATVEAYLQGLY